VDSGSTDDSVGFARNLGVRVVELETDVPFTAARARNVGFDELRRANPSVEFVQFVDGDCEVIPGWLEAAAEFLSAHPDVGVVCGRRRERSPEGSVYNRLCDIEWDTPVGEARGCGGDAMMRASTLTQAGRFRDDMIAGEDTELCVRVRAKGWRIWRLDAEMTLHDAAITRFSQWWRRSKRAGFAFAEGAHLHGASQERHCRREARSALVWGAAIPALALAGAIVVGPVALLILLVYPVQFLRLTAKPPGPPSIRALRAFFLLVAKFPEALGQLSFLARRLRGARARLIEYK
jgi:glycosyltransferase involved in cell wall biosynthesis